MYRTSHCKLSIDWNSCNVVSVKSIRVTITHTNSSTRSHTPRESYHREGDLQMSNATCWSNLNPLGETNEVIWVSVFAIWTVAHIMISCMFLACFLFLLYSVICVEFLFFVGLCLSLLGGRYWHYLFGVDCTISRSIIDAYRFVGYPHIW